MSQTLGNVSRTWSVAQRTSEMNQNALPRSYANAMDWGLIGSTCSIFRRARYRQVHHLMKRFGPQITSRAATPVPKEESELNNAIAITKCGCLRTRILMDTS